MSAEERLYKIATRQLSVRAPRQMLVTYLMFIGFFVDLIN